MLVEIVGRERQDFKLDNGYEFHGVKYYAVVEDEVKENLQGKITTELKIADGTRCADHAPMELNSKYVLYFNQKGKVDYLREASDDDFLDI